MNTPTPHLISSPSPKLWEFLLPSGSGTRVVRIFLHSPTPRIMFFSRSAGGEILPTSLFLDEIDWYIQQALDHEGRGPLHASTKESK